MEDRLNHNLSIFRDEFEESLEVLMHKHEIECLYLGDAILPDIGACSVYLPIDIRSKQDKLKKDFNRHVFDNIDGKTIENAQFNSVLMPRKELDTLPPRKGLKIDWDAPNIKKIQTASGETLYELMAVNIPFSDEISTFGCPIPKVNKHS